MQFVLEMSKSESSCDYMRLWGYDYTIHCIFLNLLFLLWQQCSPDSISSRHAAGCGRYTYHVLSRGDHFDWTILAKLKFFLLKLLMYVWFLLMGLHHDVFFGFFPWHFTDLNMCPFTVCSGSISMIFFCSHQKHFAFAADSQEHYQVFLSWQHCCRQ